MSRSRRRPYSCAFGVRSAKQDKRLAARGVRTAQNRWLRTTADFESALIPHRLECSSNEVFCWGRDGSQRLKRLDHEWSEFARKAHGLFYSTWERVQRDRRTPVWPPKFYQRLCRK